MSSCFRARAGSAAFWFPAWTVRTERILVARHSAGHSCTVLSARSTNFRNDAGADSFGGVQDRFCFHPNQYMIVGTLLPSDQDGGFFRGDPDLHVPIMSGTAQEIHEKYDFVSCQPSLLVNLGNRPRRPCRRQTFQAGPTGCAETSPPPRPE